MPNCSDYKALLMGLLDNELSADELTDVNNHLIRCASCRADYEALRRIEKKLEAVSFTEIGDEAARAFWRLPYSRAMRFSGLALIFGGYLALIVVGLITFFTDAAGDPIESLPIAAIVIGFIVLLGLVIIDRLISWQSDPYKEIER